MELRQQHLNIVLIETVPIDMQGSMTVYTDMLLRLPDSGKSAIKLNMYRINLAPSLRLLNYIPHLLRNWFLHAWIMVSAFFRLPIAECDVFHITDGSCAYVASRLKGRTLVTSSHDVIPLLQSQKKFSVAPPGFSGSWLIDRSIRGLKHSDVIISVSHNTKKDLIDSAGVFSGKIRVIHSAIPLKMVEIAKALPGKSWIEKRGESYIFHIGNNGFYKNREGVVRIFSLMAKKSEVRLKMAGPAPGNELKTLINRCGLSGRVEFIVDPDNCEIADLYNNASLLLFPSLYEGFGWPPLEAMLFGCPVVCSNAASLPEVVGNAALTCSADDETRMADNCAMILNDEVLAEKMIQRGYAQIKKFNIENMSREVRQVYRCVCKV